MFLTFGLWRLPAPQADDVRATANPGTVPVRRECGFPASAAVTAQPVRKMKMRRKYTQEAGETPGQQELRGSWIARGTAPRKRLLPAAPSWASTTSHQANGRVFAAACGAIS